MNLYEIQQNLLDIFQELDAQDGVFTEEQLKELEVAQGNFKEKLEDYYKLLNKFKSDVNACKDEEDRIKALRKSKENAVNRIKNIMTNAVIQFGDVSKSGTRYIDLSTIKLSTRLSSSCEIDEVRVQRIYDIAIELLREMGEYNEISADGFLSSLNALYKATYCDDNDDNNFKEITSSDLSLINVSLKGGFNLSQIIRDFKTYEPIINNYEVEVSASKSDANRIMNINEQEVSVAHKQYTNNLQIK